MNIKPIKPHEPLFKKRNKLKNKHQEFENLMYKVDAKPLDNAQMCAPYNFTEREYLA